MEDKLVNIQEIEIINKKMDDYIERNDADLENYCISLQNKKGENPYLTASLYYAIGNGYSSIHMNSLQKEWNSPAVSNAVVFFRKALQELKKTNEEDLKFKKNGVKLKLRYSEIYSRTNINLANYLKSQYRHIEALDFYENAIASGNSYGLVTKSRCLIALLSHMYDDNVSFFISKEIYKLAQKSFSSDKIETYEEKEYFERLRDEQKIFIEYFENAYPQYINTDKTETYTENYKSRKQKTYMKWIGDNRLYLNIINQFTQTEYAYTDCLSLPTFGMMFNSLLTQSEELAFHSHFDEMKDTYCYARYIYFSAVEIPEDKEHLYNSTYSQIDSLDYTINNIKINHYKTALRGLYSLLDKIAFFIYKFYKTKTLKIKEHNVTISSIFANNDAKKWIDKIDNPFLIALYFITKDINDVRHNENSEDKERFYLAENSLPTENKIHKMRNALEHRSLKIVDDLAYEMFFDNSKPHKNLDAALEKLDTLESGSQEFKNLERKIEEKKNLQSYHFIVPISLIEEQTMELLTISRNALIYLALSVHYHERKNGNSENEVYLNREVPYKKLDL